jgi:uncharacterized membrane protein YheB (UPF0754 family)
LVTKEGKTVVGQVFQIILIPVIGAIIGWVTNVLAIRLLFYPRQPFRLPVVGYEVQGLIPKRRLDLARDIGRVVEKELLSLDDVLTRINTPEIQLRIADTASKQVVSQVKGKIPNYIPRSVVRLIEEGVYSWLLKEFPSLYEKTIYQVSGQVKEEIKVAEIIEHKLHQFELEKFEELVNGVASREFRHIEWVGAILGFFIGLVQVGVFYVFQ